MHGDHEHTVLSLARLITPEVSINRCIFVLKPVDIDGLADVNDRLSLPQFVSGDVYAVANRQSFG